VLLCVVALSLIVAGIFLKYNDIGKAMIGLGAGMLLAAVVVPGISQVEFGFPSVVKVTAAVRDRDEKLRQVFEQQRPDLEGCAKLLCNDAATAKELLEAAIARATVDWRGPINPEIRTYVLCWFVHRLMAHSEFEGTKQPAATPANSRLSELTTKQRVVLVLTSKAADVPIEEVAKMVDLSPAEAQAELSRAEKVFADAGRRGDV